MTAQIIDGVISSTRRALLKEKVTNLTLELMDQNIKLKITRCDDSGENKALEDICKIKGFGIYF
jgi:hypothetical protein